MAKNKQTEAAYKAEGLRRNAERKKKRLAKCVGSYENRNRRGCGCCSCSHNCYDCW